MDREPFVHAELMSQPACWRRAVEVAARSQGLLPRDGERVAVVGCGTSWFMAQAYAALRESAGQGETDAFAASEMPRGRAYDRLLAITRSGTTTEVLMLLGQVRGEQPTLAVTGDPGSAVVGAAETGGPATAGLLPEPMPPEPKVRRALAMGVLRRVAGPVRASSC